MKKHWTESPTSNSESVFRRFERFARSLIKVPKKEVEAVQTKYRKANSSKKKAPSR